jgi:DNA-binding NtrC family response regulator
MLASKPAKRGRGKKPSHKYNPQASPFDYYAQVMNFKKDLITRALIKCHWHKSNAAKLLDINRPFLYEIMRETKIKNRDRS